MSVCLTFGELEEFRSRNSFFIIVYLCPPPAVASSREFSIRSLIFDFSLAFWRQEICRSHLAFTHTIYYKWVWCDQRNPIIWTFFFIKIRRAWQEMNKVIYLRSDAHKSGGHPVLSLTPITTIKVSNSKSTHAPCVECKTLINWTLKHIKALIRRSRWTREGIIMKTMWGFFEGSVMENVCFLTNTCYRRSSFHVQIFHVFKVILLVCYNLVTNV